MLLNQQELYQQEGTIPRYDQSNRLWGKHLGQPVFDSANSDSFASSCCRLPAICLTFLVFVALRLRHLNNQLAKTGMCYYHCAESLWYFSNTNNSIINNTTANNNNILPWFEIEQR